MDVNIREAIRALAANGNELYAKLCRVVAVDADKKTVDVEPLDGTAGLFDVPLQADVQGEGLVSVPKSGSVVLAVFLGKHTAVVSQVSEVDVFRYAQNGLLFELDSEAKKMGLSNADTGLLQLFGKMKDIAANLNDIVTNLIVLTSMGPSTGLDPASIASLLENTQAIMDFETSFKKLLK
jgi:hypothetical protein